MAIGIWKHLWHCGVQEPLSRVVFAKACPTSHDVNLLTRGSDHLDIIIGFSTGDIVWFDPLCNKYGRINKGVRTQSNYPSARRVF